MRPTTASSRSTFSDLNNIRAVSSVSFDERQRPHWLATDGSRIVVVNEPAPTAERRMWMLNVNRTTGVSSRSIARSVTSTRPAQGSPSIARPGPTVPTGTGVPHGTVFGW